MTTALPFPQFRSNLEVLPFRKRGRDLGYIVRDPHTGWVFELTEADYFICRQLDGQTPLTTIQAHYKARFNELLPLPQLNAFLDQLRQCGFLDETAIISEEELEEVFGRDDHGKAHRFTLVNPDRFFSWLAPQVRWLFTHQFVLLTLPVVFFALWLTCKDFSDYTEQFDQVWTVDNLVRLALVGLLFVMIPRELIAGCALKHFGGAVSGAGINIFRFMTRVFVDLSGMRWLTKPRRMRVIFAHGYPPIVTWAIGTIGWWLTPPGTRVNTFWLLLSATAAWSALWNWNPKLPRDGYQLLSSWLEIRRLRQRSVRAFEKLLVSWEPTEPLSKRERVWFTLFGFGAWTYTIFHAWWIWGRIGHELVGHLEGAGAAIMAVGLLYWLPNRMTNPLRRGALWLLACRARLSVKFIVRLTMAIVFIVILFLPYPYQTGGTFKILPFKQTAIHAEVEGRIIEVLVQENNWVQKHQPLAKIEPREYEKNLKVTQEQLAAEDAQLRLLRAGPKPEEVEKADQQVKKAEQDVKEAEKKLSFSRPRAERFTQLYQEEVVSQQDYENAIRERDVDIEQLNVARQTLEVAKANLALVKSGARPEEIEAQEAEVRRLQTLAADFEEQLRLTTLTSPVEGRIVTPYVEQKVGQYLKKGDQFTLVADPRIVQVEVLVPEEEVLQVQSGTILKIVPWAFPKETFVGTVLSIAPIAEKNDGVMTVRVLAEIPNPHQLLRADMTGYAKVSAGQRPVWDVLLRPLIRWFQVEFWYWLP